MEKERVAPTAPGQYRLKIMAMFDTMKERNTSMSSKLKSSICTSNTSMCEADAERLTAKDSGSSLQKENRMSSLPQQPDIEDHVTVDSVGRPEMTLQVVDRKLQGCRCMTRSCAVTVKGARSPSKRASRMSKSSSASRSNKIYRLSSWSLQPVSHWKSVRIVGKLPNTDLYWLSSAIAKRVSSRVLQSTNGRLLKLEGNMRPWHSRASGFSEEILKLFKRGFPADWKDLVESSVARAEKKQMLSSTHPMPSQHNDKPDTTSPNKKQARNRSRKRFRGKGQDNPSTPVIQKKTSAADNLVQDNSTIWTPQGVMSSTLRAGEVRRTRSGRCVFPRLAHWAGQYHKRDDQGNLTIAFTSKAAESHFSAIAQHELHAPAMLRNTPMSNKVRAVKQQRKRAVKGRPANETKQNASGSEGGKAGNISCQEAPESKVHNTEIDSLEKDVMALAHPSKTNRMQKMREKKRNTSYSNAALDTVNNLSTHTGHARADSDFISLKPAVSDWNSCSDDSDEDAYKEAQKPTATSRTQATGRNSKGRGRQLQSATPLIATDWNSSSDDSDEDASEETQKTTGTRNTAAKSCGEGCSRGGGRGRGRPRKQQEVIVISNSDSQTQLVGASKNFSGAMSRDGRRRGVGQARGSMRGATAVVEDQRTRRNRARLYSSFAQDSDPESLSDASPSSSSSWEEEEKKGKKSKPGQKRGQASRGRRAKRGGQKKAGKGQAGSDSKENLAVAAAPAPEVEGPRTWTNQEIENLHRAVDSVPSDQPDYWAVVSEGVQGRSANECAAFILSEADPKAPKAAGAKGKEAKAQQKARDKKKTHDKTPVLQGKKGTLKRRRELRAILEHQSNKGNHDEDLFQATPYRDGKKAKVSAVDFSKTDDVVFGHNANFFSTPMNKTAMTGGRALSHTPASTCKTPNLVPAYSTLFTQDSAHKKDIDQYIFRQKGKKLLTKPFHKKKPQAGEGQGQSESAALTSGQPISQCPVPEGLFTFIEDIEDHDDQEQDDYFSDEEG